MASKAIPTLQMDGNGKTYDGKPRIVHHYSETERIFCKNQEIPESVLYTLDASNKDWQFIQNSKDTACEANTSIPVTGVSYDDTLKVATYAGKTFLPPKPLVVDANETPNLPDANIFDGVCSDSNGICSLQAAVEQATMTSSTDNVLVSVPAGNFNLSQTLKLTFPAANAHAITIRGSGSASTSFNGQGLVNHLTVTGNSGSLNLEGIKFTNGFSSTYATGSAVTPNQFYGTVNINSCLFDSNKGEPDIYSASSLALNVRKSQFNNNLSTWASIVVFGTKILLEDSVISNGQGMGVVIDNRTYNVVVRNTAIFNNAGTGIYFMLCMNCSIENSTVYNNGAGVVLATLNMGGSGTDYNIKMSNSTIVDNGGMSFGNLNMSFAMSDTQLIMTNSVLAIRNPAKANCSFGGAGAAAFHNIAATNSLFDDSSCAATGTGNLVGVDPKLGLLANNGGLTPTLLPLLGSPLVDAGNNPTCMATDQRGLARPVNKLGAGALCDIGAVELQ